MSVVYVIMLAVVGWLCLIERKQNQLLRERNSLLKEALLKVSYGGKVELDGCDAWPACPFRRRAGL